MFKLFKPSAASQLRKMERKYSQHGFAQEGEDLILEAIFDGKTPTGFYVDVGCYHPLLLSNTYRFYKKGWRGINIDATPGVKEQFDKHRPRDINLHQPIANGRHSLSFYMFNEPALNGFSKELSEEREKAPDAYHITKTIHLETMPLAEVLDRHLPPNQVIDFLSIDVEGLDLDVLRSNNWEKYQPRVVLSEAIDCLSLAEMMQSESFAFMTEKGYRMVARTPRTSFFQKVS
jgi:FkbM family methyltransferase